MKYTDNYVMLLSDHWLISQLSFLSVYVAVLYWHTHYLLVFHVHVYDERNSISRCGSTHSDPFKFCTLAAMMFSKSITPATLCGRMGMMSSWRWCHHTLLYSAVRQSRILFDAQALTTGVTTEHSYILWMTTVMLSNSIVVARKEGAGGRGAVNVIKPDLSCSCWKPVVANGKSRSIFSTCITISQHS